MAKFKPGDLVIGKNQSYERSIYEVIGTDDSGIFPVIILLFRSLNSRGHITRHEHFPDHPDLRADLEDDFQLATLAQLNHAEVPADSSYAFTMRKMLQNYEYTVPVQIGPEHLFSTTKLKGKKIWDISKMV